MTDTTARRRGRPPVFDRDAALIAAMRLFWRYGYEGVSIAMLTEAAGVTPPTLYAAFGSKLGVYREAVARYWSSGVSSQAAVGDHKLTAYAIVEAFLHTAADQYADPSRPPGCMVASGALRCGVDSQEAAEATAELRSAGVERFIGVLEAAKQSGELPAGTESAALARFYTAVLQGMSVQAIDGADAAALHAVVDQALLAWPR